MSRLVLLPQKVELHLTQLRLPLLDLAIRLALRLRDRLHRLRLRLSEIFLRIGLACGHLAVKLCDALDLVLLGACHLRRPVGLEGLFRCLSGPRHVIRPRLFRRQPLLDLAMPLRRLLLRLLRRASLPLKLLLCCGLRLLRHQQRDVRLGALPLRVVELSSCGGLHRILIRQVAVRRIPARAELASAAATAATLSSGRRELGM